MEQIGRMYGKFILEGIAVVCLAGFLFWSVSDDSGNVGMLEMIGGYLPDVNDEYDAYTDFGEVYLEESNKSAPQIKFMTGAIDAGVINLAQIIKAVDYSGSELPIEILSIKNMEDTELIEEYDSQTGEIYLDKAGVYTVTAKAIDDGNRVTQCRIKIPVNRRQVLEDID